MASTDARPVPRKNVAYRAYFPVLDNTGALVSGAAGLDSEVSIDGGNFADCTNEATEIQSTGLYYLDLVQAEMNGDAVVLQVKTSTTDAKPSVLIFYPEELGDFRVDDTSGVTTLLSRLTSTRAGYLDHLSAGAVATASKLLSYFQSALRKDVTVDSDIGGSYDDATDSLEAIRDRGDAAWTGGEGGGGTDWTSDERTAIRTILGIPSSGTTPEDPADGILDDIRDLVEDVGEDVDDALLALADILSDTAEIGAAGAGLTAVPWNAAWDAEVQSEATDALNAYDPPTRAELTSDVNSVLAILGTPAGASLAADILVLDNLIDTEIGALLDAVGAIQAKTDLIPASPAAVGSAMTLSTAGYEAAADALLARRISGGANTGRTVKQALYRLRNRVGIAAGTATVYAEDDSTPSWTAAVTTTAGDPVSEIDPT